MEKSFQSFALLHNHSQLSWQDGIPTIKEHLRWCLQNGIPSISITEHGNASSFYDIVRFPQLIKEINKEDKTDYPLDACVGIPGVELYVKLAPEDKKHYHICCWATSNEGYFNLMKLSSVAFKDTVSFFGSTKARVTFQQIMQYRAGIKIGTACMGSPMGSALLRGEVDLAEKLFQAYVSAFGDDLYVELHASSQTHQHNRKTGQFDPNPPLADGTTDYYQAYNRFMLRMARKHGGKVVAVTDAHFLSPEDKILQDIMLMAGSSTGWRFHESCHQKRPEEIYRLLKAQLGDEMTETDFEQWGKNANEVGDAARSIKVDFDYHLPKIEVPTEIQETTQDYNQQLKDTLMMRIREHGRWREEPEYVERYNRELDVIADNEKLNFIPYFLVYEDLCKYARSQGELQNIARGSAGGCLISYYLKIIHIDPVEHKLPFERFLSHARIRAGSFPDIDCDFQDRKTVVKYLMDKYGLGFAQVATYTKMKVKNAIKDSMWATYGRMRNDPEVEAVCKTIEDSPQGVDERDFLYGYTDQEDNYYIGEIERNVVLADFFRRYPEVEKLVERLIGIIRGTSRHASAFVVSSLDLAATRVPIMYMQDDDLGTIPVTQYDAKMVEKSGLVKADILKIVTLQAVAEAIRLIKDRHNVNLMTEDHRGIAGIYRLPDDQGVYGDFCRAKTDSSFQFNSDLIKKYLPDFMPTSRENLSDLTALCRPGSLDAPFWDTTAAQYYVQVRKGSRSMEFLHPDLEPILKETNGVFCIAEGMEVLTDKGLVEIQDVLPGCFVMTEDGTYQRVTGSTAMGVKETIEIRTNFGRPIRCTPDHKMLTSEGWKQAGELTEGDIVKGFFEGGPVTEIGDDKDWLIGQILADGDARACTVVVACSSKKRADFVCGVARKEFGLKNCHTVFRNRCWYASLGHHKQGDFAGVSLADRKTPLVLELERLGIRGKDSFTKKWPVRFSLSTVAGFMEGDGCIDNHRIRIKNGELAKGVYLALQSYGIHSTLRVDPADGVDTIVVNELFKLPLRFEGHKLRPKNNSVVVPFRFPAWASRSCGISESDLSYLYAKKRKGSKFVSKEVAHRIGLDSDHDIWGKVLDVKRDNKRVNTYDLSVDNNHSFLVHGLVVHNCYQEQVMQFLVEIAGYSWEESDVIRSAIAKKRQEVIMASFDKIRISTSARGWTKEQSEMVCQQIQAFARYSFNLSHSRAYAELGYITMWLKKNYSLEWWTGALNSKMDKEVDLRKFVSLLGPIVKPPDLIHASDRFHIVGDSIVSPLSIIKKVGNAASRELMAKRPFTSFDDFMERVDHRQCNTGAFGALVKGRAADSFMDLTRPYGEARVDLLNRYKLTRKKLKKTFTGKFPDELYACDPITIYKQERDSNQAFNKVLLQDATIQSEIAAMWPGLKSTGRPDIPFTIAGVPVLSSVKLAAGLYENGHQGDVGMILLFHESSIKKGVSAKTGRPYMFLTAALSDGVDPIECVQWDIGIPWRLLEGTIVFVRGNLKPGFRSSVAMSINEVLPIEKVIIEGDTSG